MKSASSKGIRAVTARARTGCLTCRTRRVKCDEAKPLCARCKRYGAECEYPALVTLDEVVARRHRPRSNSASRIAPPIAQAVQPEAGLPLPTGEETSVTKIGLNGTQNLNPLDEPFTLDYCLHYALSSLVDPGLANPWISHVFPLIRQEDVKSSGLTLGHALRAFGAAHRSISKQSTAEERTTSQRQALYHRRETILSLRKRQLVMAKKRDAQLDWNAACAAGLLLMLGDSLTLSSEWREPWRMMTDMVKKRAGREGILDSGVRCDPLASFLLDCLCVLDCFASISASVRPVVMRYWKYGQYGPGSLSPPRIDSNLLPIVFELSALFADKARLDEEFGSVDVTSYELLPYANPEREQALFGGSEERRRRRALGLEAQAIHGRRKDWLSQYEQQMVQHDHTVRRRSLALAHACWLCVLTDCYLEDIGKPTIQEGAVWVLGLCEEIEYDQQHFGWPLMVASSIVRSPSDRKRALNVLERSYPLALTDIIRRVWDRFDTSDCQSLARATLEMGVVNAIAAFVMSDMVGLGLMAYFPSVIASEQNQESLPAMTITACRRCKTKKRKCDGSKPSCSRCRTQDESCIYDQPTTTTSVADLKRRLDQLESSMNKRQKSDSHEGPVAVSPVVSTTTTGSGTIGRMPQRSSPWEAQRSPEAAVRPKGFPLASAGALEEMREQIDLEMSTNSARSGSPDTDWQMSRGLSPSQSQDRDAASHRNTNRPVHRRPPSGSGEEKSDLSVIDTMVEPGLAKRLFDQFFQGLGPYIALLDPMLHTIDYCRRTSETLYTTILAVTAQAYEPDLYDTLVDRVEVLLGRAFILGTSSIGLCQSLSIMSVWKRPHEDKAWLWVGHAIRMAYKLGINREPQRPLPADLQYAREILNGERTFRQLACFDRTMSSLHGLEERMIAPEVMLNMVDWVIDHPEVYCSSDGMLAAAYPHSEAIDRIIHSDTASLPLSTIRLTKADAVCQLNTWKRLWLGPRPLEKIHPIPLAVVQSYGLAHEFELMVWAAKHLPEDSHPGTITELLNLAIRLFNHAVTELKWHDIFAYAPDPVSLKLARTAVWVYKNCPHVEVDERAEVQSLLEKLGEAYEVAANTANNAAYHARFFKYMGYRMSRRDGVDSKRHPRGNHTTNDSKMKPSVANITAEQVAVPEFLDLEAFLSDTERWFPEGYFQDLRSMPWLQAEGPDRMNL